MEFRALKENEIDVRVGQIYAGKGVTFLLYKDARVDQNILDETVGAERWQREHYEVKGNLFCRVGIYFDNIGWVWKSDCGTESYTEKEKGESSDSFKRACVNWGIGRELYTAPLIWVKAENLKKLAENSKGKLECKDKLRVKHIKTVNGKIEQLIIYNGTTKEDVLTYGLSRQSKQFPVTNDELSGQYEQH